MHMSGLDLVKLLFHLGQFNRAEGKSPKTVSPYKFPKIGETGGLKELFS